MKTVTPLMKAHIESDVTTLATCWNITRQDGVKFFYTEHDRDIVYKGHTYRSTGGFSKSAIKSNATLAADNMEVSGFLEDAGISDDEMRNGAFDFAKVEVFAVNYMDLSDSMGIVKLRSGYFGEVKTSNSGAFIVELRGLIDMLGQKIGRTYLPECDRDLGDDKCGVKVFANEHKAGARYGVGDRVVFPVNDLSQFTDRHYPDSLDPNVNGNWQSQFVVGADLNMTPYKGPKVLFLRGENSGAGFTRNRTISAADLGITAEELALQAYQITITGRYFEYHRYSRAYASVRCMQGALQLSTAEWTAPKNERPGRTWRTFKVTIPLHAATQQINVILGTADISEYKSRPATCFDDLDIYIEPVNRVRLGYAAFANREYECTTAGRTATTPPTFTTDINDSILDGSVVWKSVFPKYAFYCRVVEDADKSYLLKIDMDDIDPSLDEDFFDWGVLKFLTGDNVGRSIEAMNMNFSTGVIKLALPLPYQTKQNDTFILTAGCDKRFATCRDRFLNQLNFRGFPVVPGEGQYFKVAGT